MQWKAEKSRHKIQPFHTIQLRLYTKESRNQYKSTIARVSFYKCFFLKIIQNAGFKELCLFLIYAASQYSPKKTQQKTGAAKKGILLGGPGFFFLCRRLGSLYFTTISYHLYGNHIQRTCAALRGGVRRNFTAGYPSSRQACSCSGTIPSSRQSASLWAIANCANPQYSAPKPLA